MIFRGRFVGVSSAFHEHFARVSPAFCRGFVEGLLGHCFSIRSVFAAKVVRALKSSESLFAASIRSFT
jgi:hypothetical protein